MTALAAQFTFRISEMNVMELIQTKDVTRRCGLLRFVADLSAGAERLALPTLIVRRIAPAEAQNLSSLSTTVRNESRDVLRVMRSPDLADEYLREVGQRWSTYVNGEFDAIAVSMRDAEQSARSLRKEPWFRSASTAIKSLMIDPGLQFRKFAARMYLAETGLAPADVVVDRITSHPAWKLLFAATVFAMYRRFMKAEVMAGRGLLAAPISRKVCSWHSPTSS